mmetsp:Transcript_43884/g.92330  ORF Transcript_43884/g.92330 Transcript_43884/m.92330 type:complete len:270 (-) Transcript_43884:1058-1867(-)
MDSKRYLTRFLARCLRPPTASCPLIWWVLITNADPPCSAQARFLLRRILWSSRSNHRFPTDRTPVGWYCIRSRETEPSWLLPSTATRRVMMQWMAKSPLWTPLEKQRQDSDTSEQMLLPTSAKRERSSTQAWKARAAALLPRSVMICLCHFTDIISSLASIKCAKIHPTPVPFTLAKNYSRSGAAAFPINWTRWRSPLTDDRSLEELSRGRRLPWAARPLLMPRRTASCSLVSTKIRDRHSSTFTNSTPNFRRLKIMMEWCRLNCQDLP